MIYLWDLARPVRIGCNILSNPTFINLYFIPAKSTNDCKTADPLVTVAFHQADIGEYLRSEEKFL